MPQPAKRGPDPVWSLGGLVALVVGAELLVRAGTRLAIWRGIRPIIVGLTVVSLGTSVPELAIGIDAAVSGSPGLAVGNIVGTNLVNILLVAYTTGVVRVGGRETSDTAKGPADADAAAIDHRPLRQALILLAGMAVVVVGAELLVDGAVSSARALGVSDTVIGLTIVAIGTSAPELVTTVMSTLRGDRDIAIGNLIGSSIYNIGVILGLTILVAPHGLPVPADVLAADLVLLAVVAAAAVPVFLSGARITRIEGGLFVGTYLGYLTWLLLART